MCAFCAKMSKNVPFFHLNILLGWGVWVVFTWPQISQANIATEDTESTESSIIVSHRFHRLDESFLTAENAEA